MERTDTRGSRIPEGKEYLFTISEVPEKFKTQSGKIQYAFSFGYIKDGRPGTYQERFMVWQVDDLLRALGCKEVKPGEFEWEREEQISKQVITDIEYEPDFRDVRDEKSNPRTWPRMKNIRAVTEEDVNKQAVPQEEEQLPEEEEPLPF